MKKIINKLKELWRSESPRWGKIVTNIGVLLASLSATILGIEELKKDWIPELYTTYAKHAFTLSLIIAAVTKFTKKKPNKEDIGGN